MIKTPLSTPARKRARWMRLDTAQILKRFYFCERSLVVSCSAWLPCIAPLEIKTLLPLFAWQNTETAHQLRNRVFELRYPNRLLEHEGADQSLVDLFNELKNAPSLFAFLDALGQVLLPALAGAYAEYLRQSDPLADAPTHRFLALSLDEKKRQIKTIVQWTREEFGRNPRDRETGHTWSTAIRDKLTALGGVGTDHAPPSLDCSNLPGSRTYRIPEKPARDDRYWRCRYYWPDNVDPAYPYGDGVRLQMRAAISHLNEVWAVETGGLILNAFADVLPWEWIHAAARWTYDEARHCRMGQDRLAAWGFEPGELPLGSYIYESARGQDPIYRLGMLFFFETKNIGSKPRRVEAFRRSGDQASEHDMDFDWADETIHASYGKTWLQALLKIRGQDPDAYDKIRVRCGELVEAQVKEARPKEMRELRAVAEKLISKAESLRQIA